MTNEEMIQDLKQFIEATVSQQMAGMAMKDDIKDIHIELKAVEGRLGKRIDVLDQKLDTIQDAIADTLTHVTENADTKLEDHEQRLRHLEHQVT